jgi:hypothetical protein
LPGVAHERILRPARRQHQGLARGGQTRDFSKIR